MLAHDIFNVYNDPKPQMGGLMADRIIGDIERNPTEIVRVGINSYKGKEYVDMRIYYKDDAGEWKPTKKGVTVVPEKLDAFLTLLGEAKAAFEAK